MTDDFKPSLQSQAVGDFKRMVSEGVKDASNRVNAEIDKQRQPGSALDVFSKVTQQAPLGALFAAFLVGAFVARRRRW